MATTTTHAELVTRVNTAHQAAVSAITTALELLESDDDVMQQLMKAAVALNKAKNYVRDI